MIDAASVFNPRDFESIQLLFSFQNITTRTEVRDQPRIKLVELGDRTLTLELPAKSCNEKHNVLVTIFKVDQAKKSDSTERKIRRNGQPLVSVTGKVLAAEDVGEEVLRVEIECVQYDERSWSELLSIYSRRQAEIDGFLAAARGF